MNTPRLRRGGGIASSSNLVSTCIIGTPIAAALHLVVVYFVCDSASELERWALLPFCFFPALTSLFF